MIGLIHMNGRVYDPEIGVFLSADPLVQFPYSTQGLNRYAYVGNNPLSYTDPSGHLIFGLVAMAIIVKANVTWYAAMAIAAVAGYLDTGDLKAGIFSGISAGLAYGAGQFVSGLNIGNPFTDAFVRATTHGLVQGAVGAAQGGRFGSAALAGFTSSILGPTPDGGGFSVTNTPLGDVIQSAIVGGTASKIGGGKFANGAMTGAFVQALNHQSGGNQAARSEPDLTITPEQLAMAEAGDRLGFWRSRLQSGDPLAQLALDIIDDVGLGRLANNHLKAHADFSGLNISLDDIGVELMRAHARATIADTQGVPGLLNARQVARYHHDVFSAAGLDHRAFGGTPFTGSELEARVTATVWCRGCDRP